MAFWVQSLFNKCTFFFKYHNKYHSSVTSPNLKYYEILIPFSSLMFYAHTRSCLYKSMNEGFDWVCSMCMLIRVLAKVVRADGGVVLLGSSSQGKHLVFIRHDRAQRPGAGWQMVKRAPHNRGSPLPPTSVPWRAANTHTHTQRQTNNI